MDNKLRKEIRFLKIYALISSVLLTGMIFIAATGAASKTKFDEIDVERINIVEADGTLRLTVSNQKRSPGVVMAGKYFPSRAGQRAGLIFFNDKGDECGGMTWHGNDKDGKIAAGGGLMFDQFNQDQTVGLNYSQRGDERTSGLMVWERPLMSPEDMALLQQLGDLEMMADGPEKIAAIKKWRDEISTKNVAGALRVFVGRGQDNESVVRLNDPTGKPRLILSVDKAGRPTMKFLDENGKATFQFPAAEPGK